MIRNNLLGRLTKIQKKRLVIEFRKLVMVFSSLKLGSLEIETEALVDFIDDGKYETISRWDMDKFNCEMKGKDFRKIDEEIHQEGGELIEEVEESLEYSRRGTKKNLDVSLRSNN